MSESVRDQLTRLNVRVGGLHVAVGPVHIEPPAEVIGTVYPCRVGQYSCLNSAMIGSLGSVTTIGRYCLSAKGSQIGVGGHPTDWLSIHFFQYRDHFSHYPADNPYGLYGAFHESTDTTIGSDTWIGANAFIASGVTVGPGAIIAAGAVVVKDVPPYAIVGGVPAKVIRYRFADDLIARLLAVRWWDFDHEAVSRLPFNDVPRCLDMLEERLARGELQRREAQYIGITNAPGEPPLA